MYKAEVLAKLPVAQHIYFGPLLPFPVPLEAEPSDADSVQKDEHGHIHVRGEMWGDCECCLARTLSFAEYIEGCGIPVPSAFGAAQTNGQRVVPISNSVKRVPFD